MLLSCAVNKMRSTFPFMLSLNFNKHVSCIKFQLYFTLLLGLVYCELNRVRCSLIASTLEGRLKLLHSDGGMRWVPGSVNSSFRETLTSSSTRESTKSVEEQNDMLQVMPQNASS